MTSTATRSLLDRAGLVLVACVAALLAWRLLKPVESEPPVAAGTPLPPLKVDGWLNLPEGETFDPMGELVVVDCWATWCGPCREDLPRMALLAADYRSRGVKFVGLTQETAADVPLIKRAIAQTPGFDWPVGYGAYDFMNALNVRAIPTVILFGRDGKARWSGHGSGGLAEALDEALAESPRAEANRPTS
jgi:thiol-disulfide isomerase/thioredoxin